MSSNLRENCLAYLSKASTNDLLRMCATLRNWTNIEVTESEKLGGIEQDEESLAPAQAEEQTALAAKNMPALVLNQIRPDESPGWTACTRIGGETKDKIHALLAITAASLEVIANHIKQKQVNAQALLQLLWDRDEIRYDPKEGMFWK